MDKIINILLLVIIFVFDPLAISLVVAANFAFDKANQKNLYNEFVDEIEPDLWEDLEEDVNDIEVQAEVVKPPKKLKDLTKEEVKKATKEAVEDWKVVDEKDQEIKEKKTVKRILQKGPTKNRVQFKDGSTGHVNKDDNTIRYL